MKKSCSKQSDTWRQTDTEKNVWNPRLQMDTAGVIHMEDKVKESELIGKVHSAVYHQCQQNYIIDWPDKYIRKEPCKS